VIARFLILLAVAAAGLSQSESEPYFALSSARTFGSNGKPVVSLSAWNVDSLEFRVYRVNDPVLFFQQLEDPHQFGGRVPRPPQRRTVLERVHRWKRSLRANIRRGLRAQFTESPSAHLASSSPAAPPPPAKAEKGTKYSEIPVLNSEQLVLNFMQPVRAHSRWEQETVDVSVQDKGIYLVEAVRGELRAYTILIVSDAVLITKSARGRIVNMLVDRNSGQPIAGAKIAMVSRDRRLGEVETNADGVAEMPRVQDKPDDIRMVARRGADTAVNTVSGYELGVMGEEWMGYLYTDRPIYRPGHTVHFKGILRIAGSSGYTVPAGKSVTVVVNDPDQKPVYQKTLTANANGSIRDDISLPAAAALGHYFIEARAGERSMSGHFEVEEYKKPEYEVRVVPAKTRVLQGESVQLAIDARYYFGEPVAGAKVKYAVYRERYWFPLWYDAEDEVGEAAPDEDGGDQLDEQEGQLDADGKLTVTIPTAVSERKYDYRYRVEARVTDAAGREITGKGGAIATHGSFLVNVSPQRYFYEPGSKASFTVEARNYENQPVTARVRLELLKWDHRDPDRRDVKSTAEVTAGGTATLDIPQEGGSYRVRATARTPEGRDVEDYAYVWVAGGNRAFDIDSSRGVQIVPDKKTYRAGETVKLLVVTGQPDTPVYVSVEGRELRMFQLLRSPSPTVSFEVPVTVQDEPGITVSASFVRKGSFHTGMKYVKVPPVEHQLNINLTTDKPQYLPGQAATYRIDVTTADGKPAPRAEAHLR
jgi:alpha-2-macroglobulin